MYVVIFKPDGTMYPTSAFGYFNDVPVEHCGHMNAYCFVLNEKKERLIRVYHHNRDVLPYICISILRTGGDTSDWNEDENGYGCVSYLTKEKLAEYAEKGTPPDIMRRFKEYDALNPYRENQPVETNEDIENFKYVSNELYDGCIKDFEEIEDGVKFWIDGLWGYKIEIMFTGDVSYNIENHDPKFYDPTWNNGITMFFRDGYIYMIDDADINTEDFTNHDWFKAKHMSYRIIPIAQGE